MDHHDGGAFAELYYIQYPVGMGKEGLPPNLAAAVKSAHPNTTTKMEAEHVQSTQLIAVASAVASAATDLAAEEEVDTAERTRAALARKLKERTQTEEDFSGKRLSHSQNSAKKDTELVLAPMVGSSAMDEAAATSGSLVSVVRSTTRSKPVAEGIPVDGKDVVVPFCVSNWKNKNKILVSVEQRLAQQRDDRGSSSTSSGISSGVMDLARAMQQATREVATELSERERAQTEAEERRQAEVEAEEAKRAKQLLEENAARLLETSRRHESREQRLERVKVERELREREKLEKQRQRLREKAAARLNITVDDLEADEQLLRSVEDAQSSLVAVAPSASDHASSSRPTSMFTEQAEEDDQKGPKMGALFSRVVISNEGIQREMEALSNMDGTGQEDIHAHAIKLPRDEDDDDNDDEGDFNLGRMLKKQRHVL